MDYTAPAATQASSEAESDQDSDLEEQQQQQQQQQEDGHIALDVAPLSPTPWEQDDKENGPAQDPNKQEETAEFEKAAIDLPPKAEKENEGECRVCHLPFDGEFAAGETMQLGCDCKDDLSLAHRQCAETWFKIKGNRTCEICGATAQNIAGLEDVNFIDQWNDRDAGSSTGAGSARWWQSQSLCNFLLACMVIAFILPWLFRVAIF